MTSIDDEMKFLASVQAREEEYRKLSEEIVSRASGTFKLRWTISFVIVLASAWQ